MRGRENNERLRGTTVMTALVSAMALTFGACGGSAIPSTPATGTLAGRVTAGPTCPVERPDHPCPPTPVSARVQARTARGKIAASTHTDNRGRYLLELRPGAYTVEAITPKPLPSCLPVTATVRANRTTRVPISCDTGIR